MLLVRGIYQDHTNDGPGVAQGELPDEDPSKGMAPKNERRPFPARRQKGSELVRNGGRIAASRSIVTPTVSRSIVGAYTREIGYCGFNKQPVPGIVEQTGFQHDGRPPRASTIEVHLSAIYLE